MNISTDPNGHLLQSYQDYDFTGVTDVTFDDGDGTFDGGNMYATFRGNQTLSADLHFRKPDPLPRVRYMQGTFDGCTSLTAFPTYDGYDATSVIFTNAAFKNCTSIAGSLNATYIPTYASQMFCNCTSWDGDGIAMLSLARLDLDRRDALAYLAKNVPMTPRNTLDLLTRISTLPSWAELDLVHVGNGVATPAVDFEIQRLSVTHQGIEIIHEGETPFPCDLPALEAFWGSLRALAPRIDGDRVDVSGLRLDPQFVSHRNGCIISERHGLFAKHYTPSVGQVCVAHSGEECRVKRVVFSWNDAVIVEFEKPAKTAPATLLDIDAEPEWVDACESWEISHIKGKVDYDKPICLVLDQRESPHHGEWAEFIGSGMDVHCHPLVAGDSGSIVFTASDNDPTEPLVLCAVTYGNGWGTPVWRSEFRDLLDEHGIPVNVGS